MGSVPFNGWLPCQLAEFKSGPPPHVGWWATIVLVNHKVPPNVCTSKRCYRWWDGEAWSLAAFEDDTAEWAGKFAEYRAGQQRGHIVWWKAIDA